MVISTRMWAAAAAKMGAAQSGEQTDGNKISGSKQSALQQTTQQQQEQGAYNLRVGPVVSTGKQLSRVPGSTHTLLEGLPARPCKDVNHTQCQLQQEKGQQQDEAEARQDQLRAVQSHEMAAAFAQLQAAHDDLAERLAQQDLQRAREADTTSTSSSSSRDGNSRCNAAHDHQQQHLSMRSLAAAISASAAAAAKRASALRRHREAVQVFEYQQSLRQQGRAAVLPTGVLGRAWWAVQGLLQTDLYM
jgi:hypothetical protein